MEVEKHFGNLNIGIVFIDSKFVIDADKRNPVRNKKLVKYDHLDEKNAA